MYFPDNLNPDVYLKQFKESGFKNADLSRVDDEYLIIRLIACVSVLFFSSLRTGGYKSRLSSAALRKILGKHSSNFVNFVCSSGLPPIFSCGANYKVGEYSREYVLNEHFRGRFRPVDTFQQQDIAELFSGFIKYREQRETMLTYPVPELKRVAEQISVDDTDLEKASEEYEKRKVASNQEYNVGDAQLRLEIVKTGPKHPSYYFVRDGSRLYSSISSCPREYRRMFRFNGKRFVELDQCASQPFLLLRLYQEIGTSEAEQESREYHSLWDIDQNGGDFYTNLMPNLKVGDRSIVKSSLINDFLNRPDDWEINNDDLRSVWREKIQEQFKVRFPILSGAISDLKTKRKSEIKIKGRKIHVQFAVKMQQLESIVFIDMIAAECVEKKLPIYTVHDCIGCFEEHRGVVTEIAIRHLTAFCGFEPRFK